jgi:hypothetical protein
MLVRKFIGRRLAEYYAQPANAVVGSTSTTTTSSSVNLGRLLGEWHWRRVYKQLYLEQEGHWLTPVELFKPYYSNTLANFVATAVGTTIDDDYKQKTTITNSSTSSTTSTSSLDMIDVVELGGGRGTNAKLILDHLREAHPLVYQRVNYTVMDSSPSLLELQKETLLASVHADKVQFESKDMLDVAERGTSFLPPSKRPTVVLALELFDNLPHDKIRVRAGRGIEQAEVRQRKNGKALKAETTEGDLEEEVFCKLSDPLLSQVIDMAPTYTRSPISWVPTVACGVLQRLIQERPNAQLLVADFDWLPAPDRLAAGAPARLSRWAEGEPLTTSMDSTDFECYLEAPPFCDVLFPTNFGKLASFVRKAWRGQGDGGVVTVHKQADFLQLYGPEQVEPTKSWLTGFSPLLHDFANCSVLTVTRPPTVTVDEPL